MKFTTTFREILRLKLISLMILCSLSEVSFARPVNPTSVALPVQALASPIAPAVETCPPVQDPAYVNFSADQLRDPAGFHGMLLFGSDPFYISHLPMFMSPHDYQAIVEVRLPPEMKAQYLAARTSGYMTFAPADTFVLPQQISERRPIQGTVYNGHFERGGAALGKTNLELVRVIYYKKLSSTETRPQRERYIAFGNERETFLAHAITRQPDFDEVIPVRGNVPPELRSRLTGRPHVITENVQVTGDKLNLEGTEYPYQRFYRETGDLE